MAAKNKAFEKKRKAKEWGYWVLSLLDDEKEEKKKRWKNDKNRERQRIGSVKSLLERRQRVGFLKPFKSLTKLLYFFLEKIVKKNNKFGSSWLSSGH